MKNQPKIFIISAVHNNLTDTKELLKSLDKIIYKNKQIFIIDDGSTDNTSEYVQKNYNDVVILKGHGNLWWTGALHWGVEEVLKVAKDGDFIFTINNDCIVSPNVLSILVDVSTCYNRAIVGSLIVDIDQKSIVDAGVRINWKRGTFKALDTNLNDNVNNENKIQKDVDTVSTKGTLYPVEVFWRIGNFDKEHLPHYISDYEFACRAKRFGVGIIISLNAIIYNNAKRTGFGEKIPPNLGITEVKDLLLSRRSRINIIDHFWFITLCCPLQYKMQNYIVLFLKSIYLITRIRRV